MAGGDKIAAMTLEHYPGMTEQQLAEIEAEAQRRWPLDAVLIIHRYGELEPGDRIVLVVTASSHRDAAFDACRFLIDWLKTEGAVLEARRDQRRPALGRGKRQRRPRRRAVAQRVAPLFHRHCEERSDEAIQSADTMDCFASLAMTNN